MMVTTAATVTATSTNDFSTSSSNQEPSPLIEASVLHGHVPAVLKLHQGLSRAQRIQAPRRGAAPPIT
jgi:hypothetical protein